MTRRENTASRFLKALPLFGFSFIEIAVAFLRMLILTHILGPYEFGFSVAISATYAAIEQISDLAIYRFVLSSPRSVYGDAIAGAHGLNVVRGLSLACVILIVSSPAACTLAKCGDWPSFAWLAPVALIKSLEHLEIRIRERDYHYWPQFIASLVSHGLGLIVMVITAFETGSHYAFLAYLLVQAATYVLASHLLAESKFRPQLKTPYFRKALTFGVPLIINGAGLALIAQGDRLMVGTLMGLTTLGLYAVIILAGTVPIYGLFRILGPLQVAGFHNAASNDFEYNARLRLFGRALPMIAGCYALGVVAFLKPVVPLIFGARYAISDPVPLLVALIAFLRIARVEPHTSLLLTTQNTSKLALASLSPGIGLFFAIALTLIRPSIESVLVGSLIGESIGLAVMIFMTRALMKTAIVDHLMSLVFALSMVMLAYFTITVTQSQDMLLARAAITAVFFAFILISASLFLPGPLRAGYQVPVS